MSDLDLNKAIMTAASELREQVHNLGGTPDREDIEHASAIVHAIAPDFLDALIDTAWHELVRSDMDGGDGGNAAFAMVWLQDLARGLRA